MILFFFFLSFFLSFFFFFFFFNDTATTEIYTLSLHDALPIWPIGSRTWVAWPWPPRLARSEEHTSELQSHVNLVCRLLLEKKKKIQNHYSRAKKKEQLTNQNKKETKN